MPDITTPDIGIAEQLSRMRMLEQMPGITGVDPFSQDATQDVPQDPVTPPRQASQVPAGQLTPWDTSQGQFTPVPQQVAPVQGQYTPVPKQGQFDPQIGDINRDVGELSKVGTDIINLQPPVRPPISKLRAALLMPLQAMAGAAGIDTSKEYGNLIRPGYTTAMSDYQRKLAALQNKQSTLKDVIKDRLDVLKEEGVISKDQAEAAYRQADTNFKLKELEFKQQEAEIRKSEIQPLNQRIALARQEAETQGKPFTGADLDTAVEKYQKAYEQARIDGENAKWLKEKQERDAQAKAGRETTSVNQLVVRERARLDKAMEPEVRTLQALNQLQASLNNKDLDGFGKAMDVILADSAMAGAGRGITRQNLGIIKELINSPGMWEQIKGWWSGLLHPGQGSIPEATIKQIRKRVAETDRAVRDQMGYIQERMDGLDAIDPVEEGARDRVNGVMNNFYGGLTKPIAAAEPDKDRDAKIKALEQQAADVDAAIKKKLGDKK